MQKKRIAAAIVVAALFATAAMPQKTYAASYNSFNSFLEFAVKSGLDNVATYVSPLSFKDNTETAQAGTTDDSKTESTSETTSSANNKGSTGKSTKTSSSSTKTADSAAQNSAATTAPEQQQTEPAPAQQQTSEQAVQVDPTIDISTASKGYVRVACSSDKSLKAYIEMGDKNTSYDMANTGAYTNIPLSLGSGTYRIVICEQIEGSRYAVKQSISVAYSEDSSESEDISVKYAKYLQSVPSIEFNSSMAPIQKAASLTSGMTSDSDKVKAIYKFVVTNISYDHGKELPGGYVPNISTTYSTKKGICYDFAALFAAMCRSQGIPCKLVKGYTTSVDGYHAWNQVYVNGSWRIVDTSSDSVYRENGSSYSMYKSSDYVVSVSSTY